MTVAQLDEWLFDNLKEAFPKASDMELADLRIPRTFFVSSTAHLRILISVRGSRFYHVHFAMDRTTRPDDTPGVHPKTYVPLYLPRLSLTPSPIECPPLPKNIKKEGTPSVIILSLSGIRCADVVRSLKTMEPKPPGEIAKVPSLPLPPPPSKC
jgi:hypothetical protein